MSEYTRWKQLNEALGFPLGVKSATSLGIAGSDSLEEGKKSKKKMDVGGEIALSKGKFGDDDDDDGDDDDLSDDKPSFLKDKSDEPEGSCKCDEPMEKPGVAMMCKKCGKHMKKNMRKKMKESVFSSYNESAYKSGPEIGTAEFRQSFFQSLNEHFGNPNERNYSGVDLGEEVIFSPADDDSHPEPGETGFAPKARIGETPSEPVAKADWEKSWTAVAEQFIKESNLDASFNDWLNKKKKS